ncbi:MBL fold metallo-hydrolase [Aminobacter aganoensis]|uniref:Phosphoribosyl 1,2-cyclic phosphate phosphodiesterase n=1 Tax=Aminobacter aganoensis TaxID=83264 RepID=A0A7X0CC62_9HYPH|nr:MULTISPECIES: MBL fold metallo-hydrolase [Aminobacter]KQU69769.1 phosphoribosyl 1,2-cyclic phosphodiesterase [Aminobacter sp. DSM 101952]MBB6352378.1 phosphoribosyl 1,2-cyclic phosphate phosphodiesterase [Aminobacter aganoensis]
MPDTLRLTILGCGSSPGTPRITGDWGACDPANPKNRRMRAAAMVERISASGTTRVIIDTGPDFRTQMLAAGVSRIDAVVYTHPHADHIHGIDDLRGYVLERGRLIDIHADDFTLGRLKLAFGYCIETPPGSSYPPIVRPSVIEHDKPFTIAGEGGPLTFLPLPQVHGDIVSLGFRVGTIAYCSDVSDFPEATVARMDGLDLLVVDALQYKPHVSHLSLSEALQWIERLKPRRAVLTHMHVPLDYATVMSATPAHVEPAYDGMAMEVTYISK